MGRSEVATVKKISWFEALLSPDPFQAQSAVLKAALLDLFMFGDVIPAGQLFCPFIWINVS